MHMWVHFIFLHGFFGLFLLYLDSQSGFNNTEATTTWTYWDKQVIMYLLTIINGQLLLVLLEIYGQNDNVPNFMNRS